MKINYKYQGFSLVELMIAMALGLFLIAGIATVYVSSKDTYALRDQISELDENARMAITTLREHIENAGYASNTGLPVEHYILPSNYVPSSIRCPSNQTNIINVGRIFSSNDGSTANGVGGDSIGVSYLADNQLFKDCTESSWLNRCMPNNVTDLNLASREARLVYSSFKVVRSTTRRNSLREGIPELVCGGSLNTYTQPWAQGIENVQFRYGVDIAPNPLPVGQKKQWQVDQYWTATEVTNNNAWDKVALVQVAMLVRTVEPVFKQPDTQTYQLFEQQITTTDRYKHAVYTTTIYLRNIAR